MEELHGLSLPSKKVPKNHNYMYGYSERYSDQYNSWIDLIKHICNYHSLDTVFKRIQLSII